MSLATLIICAINIDYFINILSTLALTCASARLRSMCPTSFPSSSFFVSSKIDEHADVH